MSAFTYTPKPNKKERRNENMHKLDFIFIFWFWWPNFCKYTRITQHNFNCPARQYEIILQVQDYRLLWDKAQSDYKDHDLKAVSDMEQYQEVCRITGSVPNHTCIFLEFVCGFSSYVKGL